MENKLTQKEVIIHYLEDIKDWVPSFKLRGVETPYGFSGHQADRRARELAKEGIIEHRIHNGYAEYRIPVEELQQMSIL